jgi:UDPglucose 6-dehydrogenase
MGYDRRIGFEFLKPGPGWGGSCLPKDTSALIRTAEDAGYDFGLLRGVQTVNEEQLERVTAKVVRMAGGSVDGALVAAWGLTFKARTNDLRSSPALDVLSRLRQRGARVRAHDPAIDTTMVHPGLDEVELSADPYAACDGAAVLVVLTEWDEFRRLDFTKVAAQMAEPRVVDARNLLDPAALRRVGFVYDGVGR